MYLLQFTHEKKNYFLHDGETFIGGNSENEARIAIHNNTGKSISIGGFDIVKMSVDELSTIIGGVPYPIINFSGGLGIPFCGVEILGEIE